MANRREIGTMGTPLSGGYNVGEWNTKIRQIEPNLLYKEIVDNDPVVGAVLFVIGYMLSNQPWYVDAGEGPRAEEAKEFVEKAMIDMEHPWSHFILESLSMLQYGCAYN